MTAKRVTLVIAAAVVAGFGVFIYSEYSHDIRVAHARISSRSEIVDTPCGRIEYAVAGNGPAVLVIHGAGGGFDQGGLDLAQPLIDSGFRVISVSRVATSAHQCLPSRLLKRKPTRTPVCSRRSRPSALR